MYSVSILCGSDIPEDADLDKWERGVWIVKRKGVWIHGIRVFFFPLCMHIFGYSVINDVLNMEGNPYDQATRSFGIVYL